MLFWKKKIHKKEMIEWMPRVRKGRKVNEGAKKERLGSDQIFLYVNCHGGYKLCICQKIFTNKKGEFF